MLIRTDGKLKNMNGDIMKDNDGQGNVIDATFKTIMVNAVLIPVQGDSGVSKVEKYELAKKIYKNDEVDLNENEISTIKDRVGEVYSPLVVGQVYELLKI